MNMNYAYLTDVGRVRSHNEDAVAIFKNEHLLVMVAADGMGGHTSGDVASAMAIDCIKNNFSEELTFVNKELVGEWFNKILMDINEKILTYSRKIGTQKMGTTLVIAVVTKDFIAIANIGDSRAYVMAYETLRQVTKDHTFVRELVDMGQISERAAKVHPRKNVINKALGASPVLEFDFLTLENYEIDAILLCTDGLSGLVDDREILSILKSDESLDEMVKNLISKANERGGRDNVSVVLARIDKGGEDL